jgi:hypothetical protein
MSTLKSTELVRATDFERDLRERLLRKKSGRAGNSDEARATEEASVEVASFVSQISAQSVQEVDHLIAGLQGVRKKLDDTGDRIQRDVGQYAAYSQAVIELTKIVSDGMASIDKPPASEINSPSMSPADQSDE